MSNGTVVAGLAYRNETCIRAQWLWLIYAAVLVAVTGRVPVLDNSSHETV